MSKRSIENKVKFEFLAFLEFIKKATKWETDGIHSHIFHSKKGVDGLTDGPTCIKVRSYMNCYFHGKKSECEKRVYICLGEKDKEREAKLNDTNEDSVFNDKECYKLGIEFIVNLIKNNPGLWWLFVASCSKNPRVILDKDGENLTLTADQLPYIFKYVSIYPKINIKEINDLSTINENDFIDRRERSKETYVILGNGISIPFGSDLWTQLSDYLFDYLQPQYVENGNLVKKAIGGSTFSTTSITKIIINPQKYEDALYSCIYRKYEKSMHSKNTLIREIALSKIRDNNIRLISYNYDEFLEIEYNDYCDASSKIQPVCDEDEDKNIQEPKIRHVHGFISLDRKTKKGVVLTQEEYYKTYKDENWVVATQEEALKNNCLYVGSSMSDLFQMSIIDKVREEYYDNSSRSIFKAPWKCYSLLCLKGLEARDIATIYTYYLNKGIRLIFTKEFSELPKKYSDLFI